MMSAAYSALKNFFLMILPNPAGLGVHYMVGVRFTLAILG